MVAAMSVAAAAVSWWLVGDLGKPHYEDFIFRWVFGERHAAALGAIGAVVGSLAALPIALRWRPERRAAAVPVALALLAGLCIGGGLRVVTARVVGANIGGAALMLVGPFVVAGLLIAAMAKSGRLLPDPQAGPGRQP